ncbi:MAG: hypothetical protein AAFX09_11080 [Pseudomonadota bacterium]
MINLMPEASSTPPAARRRYVVRATVASLLFLPTIALASVFSNSAEPHASLIAVASAVAAIVLAGFLSYEFTALIRSLDELQRQIHLAALAIGFAGAAFLIFALGVIAIATPGEAPPAYLISAGVMVLPAGILGYYASLCIQLRSYE